MKLYVKYDMNRLCKKILQEQFDKFDLQYNISGIGEVELKSALPPHDYARLMETLNDYGIEVVENQKTALVQKIKDAITEMVYMEDKLPSAKISAYLSDKLGQNYYYLANLFSEVTYTSIENFVIMQKIERAKQLMTIDQLTLTEISYKLNYCSVAHLSSQFKKTTGLTPSAFQRIINRRREITQNNEVGVL